jgi:hypothetical protein
VVFEGIAILKLNVAFDVKVDADESTSVSAGGA